MQLSVNDGASDDQVLALQFNELDLLSEITLSATVLGNGRSQIEISGLLDAGFAPHSTLQVSTNDGQSWQTIEVNPNLTYVGGINYQDARWVNEDFNYANGWAGTGFGLSGTQRGAPENISIGEIEGRTALTYTSGPRDAAWYAANPGASTANVYKNQDGEIQDDFFWYQSSWTSSDKPYFSAHVYKGAGSTLGFRLPVKYEYSDGNLYDSWPAIWIYDNSVKLRGPNRYDISLPPVEDNEYVGWLTVGIHVSTDGDLHYFLAADHVENVFTSEHLLASNKALTAGYDGFPYAFWPVARQNDATVMISNLIYGDGNAIQDLSYSKQLNDASWSISDTQTYDNDAQLNYSFRILDVNGNVQEQLNYDSVNVQNLVDNGDIVLTDNGSLYRDSAVMSAARDPEIFQIVEGQSLTLSAGMLGVDHHTDAALLTISGVSGGIFYRDDVAVEHFSVEDLRAGRVSFVDDDNEQAPQIVLTIKEAGQPARDINLSNPYVSVNDAPLVPDNDQHINLRNSDQVTLTASILGVSDPDTNSSAVVINVISIAGLDIKLSDASVTFFTLADLSLIHI